MQNNKIIMLVVFISTAIMASVFVYHTSHKNDSELLISNNSMIFPVARDLKPVELYTANNEKLPRTLFMHHWTLLFWFHPLQYRMPYHIRYVESCLCEATCGATKFTGGVHFS